VVLAPGAEAEVVADPGCALRVQLKHGALAAELGNLRPGSLRVETELGDVLVRGTTFSVDMEDELRVVLLSGAVELIDRDQVAARMSPGKALRREAPRAAPALSEASAEDARRVNGLLRGAAQTPVSVPEQSVSSDKAENARPVQPRELRQARGADLIAEAEAARREGDDARARALYVQAAQKPGADAEVALLRHAGFELESGSAQEAERLLTEHQRRFARSRLAAEAAWIHVRALQAMGDREAMRGAARNLTKQFAGTPQARAAQRLLEQP
jgi:hypothetical protein